jgi:predicted RNA polymerase sigma factor
MRLGRILCGLAPGEPEAFGLVALLEIQASRLRARVAADGTPITLLDQDRARWDRVLINHALRALAHAEKLGGDGPYVLQAAIAACHARANVPEGTDWSRIASLYEQLAIVTGSPIVELNRAVAVGMAEDPAAALAIVDDLRDNPALKNYHLLPSVRGDLLFKLGRFDEAGTEFEVAAEMTNNEQERTLLLNRAAECSGR